MRGTKLLMGLGALCVLCGVAMAVIVGVMAQRAAHPEPIVYQDGAVADQQIPTAHVDWGQWMAVNTDIVAWLEVPDADISQPVVRESADNVGYYLTHDAYGKYNLFGCPYVDVECSWPFGKVVYILGHNISTPPAMFHSLVDADLSQGATLWMLDAEGVEHEIPLQMVSRKVVSGDAPVKRTSFADEAEFRAWAESVGFGSGVEQIVALCTCSYNVFPQNERTIVYFTGKIG